MGNANDSEKRFALRLLYSLRDNEYCNGDDRLYQRLVAFVEQVKAADSVDAEELGSDLFDIYYEHINHSEEE